MKGYITDIEERAIINDYFREVLYTDKHLQLVVMSLKPSEDIGEEVHQLDQFIRIEKGTGKAVPLPIFRFVVSGNQTSHFPFSLIKTILTP